jgi:hypothetical protein
MDILGNEEKSGYLIKYISKEGTFSILESLVTPVPFYVCML